MIQLKNIRKKFNDLIVLDCLDMTFEQSAITSILGPSGCGKTTILKIVAGLTMADEGEIAGMEQKRTAFLFQEPRLLPWRNAIANLELILPDTMDKMTKKQLSQDMLEKVGLAGYDRHYPSELSGGMSQRLSIARAFILQSDILFMDEPFQSQDIQRREQMISLFKELWQKHKPSVLMVTHDVQEALLLSDKIYILSDKPTKIIREIINPMPFEARSVQNEHFFKLEQQIINQVLLKS